MRRIALIAGSLLLASCAAYWGGGRLFRGDEIRIPHATHARAKVGCLTCHEEIYDAKSLDGTGLPKEAKCLECHRAEKERGNCAFCHTDPKRPTAIARREPRLKMSHADHIERVKEDCTRCHTALPDPLRAHGKTPPMAACLGCHEHKTEYDQGRCGACHEDLSRYPLAPVASFSHQGNFVKQHGKAARAGDAPCAVCHEQTFCSDCHASTTAATRVEVKLPERVERDFIHRNDFLSRHALEARLDQPSCQRCHGTSFCENCHTSEGLTPRSKDPRNPHPIGWVLPGSPDFHGAAARRDITTCAACHDQGPRSNCITCHKVGAGGGDPHPPGWSTRHTIQESRSNGMCLYCHL